MISASSPITTPVMSTALAGTTWTALIPYFMVLIWILALCVVLIVPSFRATMIASLYALKGIKRGLFLWTESEKKSGQWFSRTTCVAVVDSDRNIVRVFYGSVTQSLLKEFQK